MPMKIVPLFLFFLIAVNHAAADEECVWQGTAPACSGECTSPHPQKVAVGKGGCDNGNYCVTGQKVLCCPSSFQGKNCEWYGTAPFCSGECPAGKYQMGVTDSGGDGSTCTSGCKIFCCDKSQQSSTIEGLMATATVANDEKLSPAVPTAVKAGHMFVGHMHKEL